MTNKSILAAAAMSLLGCTAAFADDETAMITAQSWSGLHIGVGVGFGGNTTYSGAELGTDGPGIGIGPVDVFSIGAGLDFGGAGALATIEAGYDFQLTDRFVLGIAGDYTWSAIDTDATLFGDVCYEFPLSGTDGNDDDCSNNVVSDSPSIEYRLRPENSWSVIGRAGYVANANTMIYGLGGFTRTTMKADVDLSFNTDVTGPVNEELASYSYERDAATFGMGIETFLRPGVTAKLEYRHTAWDNEEVFPIGGDTSFRFFDEATIQTMRAGLSYRFGAGGDGARMPKGMAIDWTGLRAGVTGGMGNVETNGQAEIFDYSPGGLFSTGPFDLYSIGAALDFGGDGLIGSFEVGYDYQIGSQFVVGIQADYTFSGMETEASIFGDVCYENPNGPDSCDINTPDETADLTYTLKTGDSWSIMGRAGWLANPDTLIYGLGGFTRTKMSGSVAINSMMVPASDSELLSYSYDRDGWTIGGGIETMLSPQLSAKLEYRNTMWTEDGGFDLGGPDAGINLSEDTMVQTFRTGLSWRFN